MAGKSKQSFIIGVDLGGTKISAGALTADGKNSHGIRSVATQSELGADGVVDRIISVIEGVMADTIKETGCTKKDFLGIGVGAPGPLDREKGIVVVAPNLGWRDFPLRQRIK